MLKEALEAKRREIGGRYSYRDLERDSGINYSLASKVIRGKSPATREALEAWGKALAPHFPLNLALVDAGYAPADPSLLRQVREIVMRVETRARMRLLEGRPPNDHPSSEADGEQRQDEPDA